MQITLSDKAIKEIKKVMSEQSFSENEYAIEVSVVGGGCSGFSHRLGFKKKSEVDKLNETSFSFDGLEAVVGNKSLIYLNGTEIDFHDSLDKRGFAFRNPNSKGSCGCGSSFSV